MEGPHTARLTVRLDPALAAGVEREERISSAVRDMLRSVALDGLDDARRTAYVAHYILRFADWSAREHNTADVDFWLDLADAWM